MAALLPKPLLHIEGGCVGVVSCILYQQVHGHWSWFLILLLVPDLSMLGYLINKRLGAACYNFVHTYSVLLPWKIDDFVDEVGGKNGTADYADYTDFLGLVVSVLTGRNR